MKELDLLDRVWMVEALQRYHGILLPTIFSEYSFANLYLFRHIHRYEFDECDPCFIRGLSRQNQVYLMPLDPNISTWVKKIEDQWLPGVSLFPLTLSQAMDIASQVSFPTQVFYNLDNSDYFYERRRLAKMNGRHLSTKRNQIKQLYENYDCQVVPMVEKDERALDILQNWKQQHKGTLDSDSALEAIHLLKELELQGWIVLADSKPAGFVIGERVEDMFIAHFAKADIVYKGIYPALFQIMAQQLDEQVKWVNLEQDLGDIGLRQSKQSYEPFKMLDKYCLVRISES